MNSLALEVLLYIWLYGLFFKFKAAVCVEGVVVPAEDKAVSWITPFCPAVEDTHKTQPCPTFTFNIQGFFHSAFSIPSQVDSPRHWK